MNNNIDDGYDIDSYVEGFMPQEFDSELEAIKRAEKQARKEERITCKDRKVDYKFKLLK